LVKVSIIMTSYNKPKYVGKAIEGVLNQTFKDFELLLMDDNSNEETQKVIQPYLQDKRIKFFRSNVTSILERVQKIRYAVLINKALDKAQGRYISYATDDDVYRSERLEKMVDYLDNNSEVQIVYSTARFNYQDSNDQVKKIIIRLAEEIIWDAPCIVDHCSIMHRKAILPIIYEKWGSYWDENPEFYFLGDARFFWRLNHFWPFYPINEELDESYITELSLHYQLLNGKENTLIRLLPPQRTCRELREFRRKP